VKLRNELVVGLFFQIEVEVEGIRPIQQILRAVAGGLRPVSTSGCAAIQAQPRESLYTA